MGFGLSQRNRLADSASLNLGSPTMAPSSSSSCVHAVVMAIDASFVRQSRSTALWGSGISDRGLSFRSLHRPAEKIRNEPAARVVAAKCQDCDDDRNPDEGAEQSPHESPEEDGKQHDEGRNRQHVSGHAWLDVAADDELNQIQAKEYSRYRLPRGKLGHFKQGRKQ